MGVLSTNWGPGCRVKPQFQHSLPRAQEPQSGQYQPSMSLLSMGVLSTNWGPGCRVKPQFQHSLPRAQEPQSGQYQPSSACACSWTWKPPMFSENITASTSTIASVFFILFPSIADFLPFFYSIATYSYP